MQLRLLYLLGFFTVTILSTQSHVIHKRGLISQLFNRKSKSKGDIEDDINPRDRPKFRELMKNPVVISMLSAAVGMIVQQALQAKNMKDVCENQYVKMAQKASGFSPELSQLMNMLGCNAPNRKFSGGGNSGSSSSNNKKTTPAPDEEEDEENQNQEDNEETADDNEALESGFTPEKESRLKMLASIARGEKGAKRNFIKSLFGLNKKDNSLKAGHKLPSSSYKLDKDDAKALKDLEKELEKH